MVAVLTAWGTTYAAAPTWIASNGAPSGYPSLPSPTVKKSNYIRMTRTTIKKLLNNLPEQSRQINVQIRYSLNKTTLY